MNKSIILLTFLFVNFNIFSQEYIINGKLVSENDDKIIGAAITLLNPADSSLVNGAYSKYENGENIFELKAKKGDYLLKINHISYKENILSISLSKNLNLGNVKLKNKNINLKEIIVTSEKDYIEYDLEKKVFNVSKDETNRGKNLSDILDNIPSVSVDAEGNVSLRGSEGVRILVDGKQSGLIGRNPESLRMLSGDLVEKIEVITNPSAKYDAEGQVGIINIVLKKEQEEGFNGNTTLNTGLPDNHGISLSSNYRRKHFNFFTTLGFSYNDFPGFANTDQYFYDNSSKFLTQTRRDQNRGGSKGTYRFGTDYFINEKNTLTLSGLYSYGIRNNFSEITYKDFNNDLLLLDNSLRVDNEDEDSETIEFSLNYSLNFNDKGHQLTFNSSFIQDEDLEKSDLNQTFSNQLINELNQQSSNLEFERNQVYQLDYIYPFSEDGKFESGYKGSLRKINNDFWLKDYNDDGSFTYQENFNDNFIYIENIHAAYLMLSNKWDKISLQLGLRSEYSEISTELIKTNYQNPRDYLNFFPSINTSYKFNQLNSIQLGYSRRIDRPRFRFLMPISSFSDNRNFWFGNPDLDPEYIDSYNFSHILNLSKVTFVTDVFYRFSNDIIQRITYIDENGTTIITPENIGKRNDLGFDINISYDPLDWMKLTFNVNSFYVSIDGNSSVGNLSSESFVSNFKVSSKMNLKWGIVLSSNYNYRGPMDIPQGRLKEIWFLDIALSKDFNKNLTLTLNGSDVFSTRMRRLVTQDINYYFDQDFQWRRGLFTLNLTYRLNQEKEKNQRSNSNFDDE